MIYSRISEQQAKEFTLFGKFLWGCAYQINDDNLNVQLKATPTKGTFVKEIKNEVSKTYDYMFAPLTKQGTPRKSGHVWYGSRVYADTYEKCCILYNALIDKRKEKLKHMLAELETEYLYPEKRKESP